MMSESWEAIESAIRGAAPAPVMDEAELHGERVDRLAAFAEELHYLLDDESALKARKEELVAEIERLAGTPDGLPVKANDWNIEVTPGERWSWDKDLVAQLLEARGVTDGDEDLPDFVDRSATINRTRYERAPEEDRAYFAPALTRKEGKAKVKVWPDDPSKYRKED
jgi:hypothetical protein